MDAILRGNRSAAFLRVREFSAAIEDAEAAVKARPDFAKAHCRLGTALLGSQRCEEAYVAFARAAKLDDTSKCASQGRQQCLAEMLLWRSLRARTRLERNCFLDMKRPSHSTRIFAVSDIHFDHRINEDWAHDIDDAAFQEDVLIVAGDVADTKVAVVRGLTTLRSKFRRVFYTPGHHEMIIHPAEAERYPDSIAKLQAILEACDELGVDTMPAAVCEGCYIVPLFSWYNAEFDERDPWPALNANVDTLCKWPMDAESQVWRYMLKLNEAHLGLPYHGTVITFSHFLPRRELPFKEEYGKPLIKSVGCEGIEEQLRAVRSKAHIFGHSHCKCIKSMNGVTYAQMPIGYSTERSVYDKEGPPLLMVRSSYGLSMSEVKICG